MQQLALDRGQQGAGRGQVGNGLQKVGLALGVGALQQRDPLGQVDLQPAVVAKVGQRQVGEIHGDSWGGKV